MVKKEGWVIDIPEEEYEQKDILRVQVSDEPIKGTVGRHEIDSGYFKPLRKGFHYEWIHTGGWFKSFEEAKKHLGEGKKYEFETVIEELEIDTTVHMELIKEVAEVYKNYCARLEGSNIDAENLPRVAGYLTIAYMVRRLSVKDLPLNKERKTKSKEAKQ